MAFSGVGILLQVADYWSGVEIEAPLDGSTPVEMHGPATIDGVLIGPPNSIKCHYKQLIKIDATAAGPFAPPGWRGGEPARATNGWSVNGLVIDNSHGLGLGTTPSLSTRARARNLSTLLSTTPARFRCPSPSASPT